MPGSPDWQKITQWQGDNLFDAYTTTFTPGNTPTTAKPIAGWSGVSLRVQPTAGYGTVLLEWWADAGKVTQIRADQWGVNSAVGLEVDVPAFGPFASVTVDVTSTGDMTAGTQFRGVNNAAPGISYPITQSGIIVTSSTVAASGTDVHYMPWIRKGLANLYFDPHDTNGKLQVMVATINPDFSLNYTVSGQGYPTALLNQLLILPDDMIELHVTNQDGSASHAYDAALIPS